MTGPAQGRYAAAVLLILATAPTSPLPAQSDPELARIERSIAQVRELHEARDHDGVRATLRNALAACLALPGIEDRRDVQEVAWEIGRTAYLVREFGTARAAWEHSLDYRERTLPEDHADVQSARLNLAVTKKLLGDFDGARTLEEKVLEARMRTLPEDHVDVQRARGNLANTKRQLGDLHGARTLQEKVVDVLGRTLPEDDRNLQIARLNLANMLQDLGNAAGARDLAARVVAVWLGTLPADHKDLQIARLSLAGATKALGDLAGARDLQEQVLAAQSRTVPEDHSDLQRARLNLSDTRRELGDLAGAKELAEQGLAVWSRTLSDDHEDLQWARASLALTKKALGDLAGARELEEQVFAVQSRTLPDDHPGLQRARHSLAATMYELGDLAGARMLQQKVLEAWTRTLPDDHPAVNGARANLAVTRRALGDLAGAHDLQETVLATCGRTLAEDHADLQRARINLAITRREFGDLAGARNLLEKALAVWSRTLTEEHPDLQRVRLNLALTRRDLGDVDGARELEEAVYAVRSRTLPEAHPDLQRIRRNLAWTRALDACSDAAELVRVQGELARRRLADFTLAPREFGALASQETVALDLLLTFVAGFGTNAARPELAADALLLAQSIRGAQTRAARVCRCARRADSERAAVLERELQAAAAVVHQAAAAGDERLAAAVRDKERIERELVALAAQAGHVATAEADIAAIAAALPEGHAAAAIVGYTHAVADPDRPGRTTTEARLVALVVDRSGTVTRCPLASRTAVEELVASFRERVAAGRERGVAPREREDPEAVQRALRKLVLDPVLAAAGEDVRSLWISVDEALELVPLDALAGEDGQPVGMRTTLRPLVSLLELIEPTPDSPGAAPALLAIGGLDYDAAGEAAAAAIPGTVAPELADRASGQPDGFRALLAAEQEVKLIARYFRESFGDAATCNLVSGTAADKNSLVRSAPHANFLHLATHGYFAPESVRSTGDLDVGRGIFSLHRTVAGLSPLVLCGLALSGANLPPDRLGRHAGIITAEEILTLDLSRCHIVTLSACDASLGVRRSGQGYASLRAALQGAGARHVLTSLWKVGDEPTMELMVDFYRRLWIEKQTPHDALWRAKMAARTKGMAFRDWAGWVLTGR